MSEWPHRKHHYPRGQPCMSGAYVFGGGVCRGIENAEEVLRKLRSTSVLRFGISRERVPVILKPRPPGFPFLAGSAPDGKAAPLPTHQSKCLTKADRGFHYIHERKVQSWIWTAHVNVVKIMQSKYLHLLYVLFCHLCRNSESNRCWCNFFFEFYYIYCWITPAQDKTLTNFP